MLGGSAKEDPLIKATEKGDAGSEDQSENQYQAFYSSCPIRGTTLALFELTRREPKFSHIFEEMREIRTKSQI